MIQKAKFNQKKILLIFSILSANYLFSANPRSMNEEKRLNPRLEKEQKTFEELEKTNFFPSDVSNIISAYTVPRSIILNFLTPDLKGEIKKVYTPVATSSGNASELIKRSIVRPIASKVQIPLDLKVGNDLLMGGSTKIYIEHNGIKYMFAPFSTDVITPGEFSLKIIKFDDAQKECIGENNELVTAMNVEDEDFTLCVTKIK